MQHESDERARLRRGLRAQRAGLDETTRQRVAEVVSERLLSLPALRAGGPVAGYRAIRGEVDVDGVLEALAVSGVEVTVPRVVGEHLEFVVWTPAAPSRPGAFGIREPADGETVPFAEHAVVLAPLVAFDRVGNRLGQGGGYYDRAIGSCAEFRPVIIGVAHAFQEVDAVPVERWDEPIDAVVTERATVEFTPGATKSLPSGHRTR